MTNLLEIDPNILTVLLKMSDRLSRAARPFTELSGIFSHRETSDNVGKGFPMHFPASYSFYHQRVTYDNAPNPRARVGALRHSWPRVWGWNRR